jgi:hypothetical protein
MGVVTVNACRILEHLQKAELSESDEWFRQDYRQAFICVSLASRGERQPFITSSYRVYGSHPDKVWPKIMADRKARLGKEFAEWYDAAGNRKLDIPGKKPSIYIDEQAERATNKRLAAVLMFPKREVQSANVEQAGSVRGPKKTKGNLYEMPAASRSEKHQPLRILPA